MIDERTFESLIVTNTIVAAFCIVLLITLIVFLIAFLVPSIRRRWFGYSKKDNDQMKDLLTLSRQSSFHNLPLGSSRYNPIFEPTTTTEPPTATTQFGTLFHPQASIATLLHPTIWTSMTPSSVISSPLTVQSPSTSTKSAIPPPVPSHPPMTTAPSTMVAAQRSPKRR